MKFSDSKIVQNIAKWKRKWKGYPDWAVLESPDVRSGLRLEYAVSDNGWVPVSDGIRFIHDYLVFILKNSLFYNVEILITLKATK